MMKSDVFARVKQVTSVVFALAIVVMIAWGSIELARAFAAAFAHLNPTVGAGIVAAVATVLVSVASVLISKHLEQRNNVLKELRDKKVPAYEELIEFVFRILYGEKVGKPLTEAEVVEKFSSITQRLIVWGSDDVVQEFYLFRRFANLGSDAHGMMIMSMERIFLAIRKDLGHKNKNLGPGKLLGTFVNDLHNVLNPANRTDLSGSE